MHGTIKELSQSYRELNFCNITDLGRDNLPNVEFPAANGICSARALAKLAALVVNGGSLDGVQILSKKIVEEMHKNVVHRKMSPGFTQEITSFDQGGFNHFE